MARLDVEHGDPETGTSLYRKVTVTFNVSIEDYRAMEDGRIGIHVNFRDRSINTIRLPWECPECNNVNQPDTMYCNQCHEFIEIGERL